ncbi:hypothetical protein Tco_0768657 [Tanacetum coccineum]
MFENAFNSEFKARMRIYTRFDAQSLYDAMIFNMNSIRKYMLEITLHQQQTPQLLKQKKLMQTQEDHSNPIPALNVDLLKHDLVVIRNTCSEKEDSNSETASSKSVKESSLNFKTKDYDRRVNKRQMQTQESKVDAGKALDADLVDTESIRTKSTVQDESSRSGHDTDADDADIRPIYDEEPMAEYTEQFQVKSPMLDSSFDNQTTEYSKQSLESENILLKTTVAQFQKDFSRMEAHCIALELKYQNQALKSGQHGQILNETSNKAKIKKEIEAFETINIELEHSVAKLLTENEHLNKENETLKKHYKDLYDSIKITRSKTIEQTTSLLANNADLKAQIQEKVFAIAALKNDLRKLKGNSVDIKFAKTSVLGKPVLQSLRNQSVVRQPNAFKSERPQMSKPRNSSKNMPRFSSNDMVHNHYLDEARKKTQEREVNSRAKIQSHKTRNSNKPVDQKSHTQKPGRWIPTGKLFDNCTSKVDSESTHGSNVDISNIHECKQTLVSVVAEKVDISETSVEVDSKLISKMTFEQNELESLFGPLSDKYFNGENQVVSKSSAITAADASVKRQQEPDSTSSTSTLATTVSADGNFDL